MPRQMMPSPPMAFVNWPMRELAAMKSEAAMKITGAILAAVWAQDRNIGDDQVLAELLGESGLDARRLAQSDGQEVRQRYEATTQQAIDAGVFGAPSYVIDGEIFWGQDRLDFVARKLGVSI